MSTRFKDAPTATAKLWEPHDASVRWWGLYNYVDQDTSWNIQGVSTFDMSWRITTSLAQDISWLLADRFTLDSSWNIYRWVARFQNAPTGTVTLWEPIEAKVRWRGLYGYIDRDILWRIREELHQDASWKIWRVSETNHTWYILTSLEQDSSWKVFNALGVDLSWYIKAELTNDFSWLVCNGLMVDSSWNIFIQEAREFLWYIRNGLDRDLAWKIFKQDVWDSSWDLCLFFVKESSWKIESIPAHPIYVGKCRGTPFEFKGKATHLTSRINSFSFSRKVDKSEFNFYAFPRSVSLESDPTVTSEEGTSYVGANQSSSAHVTQTEDEVEAVDIIGSYTAKPGHFIHGVKPLIFTKGVKNLVTSFVADKQIFELHSIKGKKHGGRA